MIDATRMCGTLRGLIAPRVGRPFRLEFLTYPPAATRGIENARALCFEFQFCSDLWRSLPTYRADVLAYPPIGWSFTTPENVSFGAVIFQLLLNHTDEELIHLADGPLVLRTHAITMAFEDLLHGCP